MMIMILTKQNNISHLRAKIKQQQTTLTSFSLIQTMRKHQHENDHEVIKQKRNSLKFPMKISRPITITELLPNVQRV